MMHASTTLALAARLAGDGGWAVAIRTATQTGRLENELNLILGLGLVSHREISMSSIDDSHIADCVEVAGSMLQ